MTLDEELRKQCVNTIRFLAADAVQKAQSGHPGAPMGMADIAFVLWTEFLRYHPQDPLWVNRDRFVLSAGHASMLLYAMLHLSEYDLSLEEIKNFRQWDSKTPGHPEYRSTPGVECTTGPLGAGFANAVGMALAAKMMGARFNNEQVSLIDSLIYVLCSDGDLQEGVTAEAASFAGHLGLGNLVAIYDSNQITIAGDLQLSMTEDIGKRFEAYGWHVQHCDGHDHSELTQSIRQAQQANQQPSLIIARTIIGKGSPTKAGQASSHGAPLGETEILTAKKALGWSEEPFLVPEAVREVFQNRNKENLAVYQKWHKKLANWQEIAPEQAQLWHQHWQREVPTDLLQQLIASVTGLEDATRNLSGKVIQKAATLIPALIGGSADLEGSTKTLIQNAESIRKSAINSLPFSDPAFLGRNIHYGIREHAMGSITNGLNLYGSWKAFSGTFLVFSDYMRPSLRLAALSEIPSIFVFTHDSYAVGEDGPTHQPVEHHWALRLIPGLEVWRPADAIETAAAWAQALSHTHIPSALLLTRQKTATLQRPKDFQPEVIQRGAYLVADFDDQLTQKRTFQLIDPNSPGIILISTGSEGGTTQQLRHLLQESGVPTRHVSMPCVERFDNESDEYQQEIIIPGVLVVAIEAGCSGPWIKYADYLIGQDNFGASAPIKVLDREFGFEPEQLKDTLIDWLVEDGIIE